VLNTTVSQTRSFINKCNPLVVETLVLATIQILRGEDFTTIIAQLPYLRELTLSEVQTQETVSLSSVRNLEYLKLEGLSPQTAEKIVQSLPGLNNLKTLVVSSMFRITLPYLPQLRKLVLFERWCGCTQEFSNVRNIEHLVLYWHGACSVRHWTTKAIENLSNLKVLEIKPHFITPIDLLACSQMINLRKIVFHVLPGEFQAPHHQTVQLLKVKGMEMESMQHEENPKQLKK